MPTCSTQPGFATCSSGSPSPATSGPSGQSESSIGRSTPSTSVVRSPCPERRHGPTPRRLCGRARGAGLRPDQPRQPGPHRRPVVPAPRRPHRHPGRVRAHDPGAPRQRALPGRRGRADGAQCVGPGPGPGLDRRARRGPALDREAHSIDREFQRDLATRRAAIAADPPKRFADWLGPRPNRGSADLWDDAAAHIDQHRSAFGITNDRNARGSVDSRLGAERPHGKPCVA